MGELGNTLKIMFDWPLPTEVFSDSLQTVKVKCLVNERYYIRNCLVSKRNTIRTCTLRKKCLKFFLFVLSRIWTEYRKIRTRKNSVFGHFLRSISCSNCRPNLFHSIIILFVSSMVYQMSFDILNRKILLKSLRYSEIQKQRLTGSEAT